MVVLIIGGCGYIGSHTVRQLSENKEDLIVLDNLSTGSELALINGERLIKADLADMNALDKVFSENKIDSILHFAASIEVPESIINPIKYYKNNSQNTLNLLEICVKYKVKNFIFSSTAAIYGHVENGFACEDKSIPQPLTPYGRSKLMSEYMIQDIAKVYDLNYIILRYFNVAGAEPLGRMGQRNKKTTPHLIKASCMASLGLEPNISIFGTDYETPDGTCIRDYIHIEDLANAHIKALEYLKKNNNSLILNVGYGQGNSVKEVIEMTKKVGQKDFEVIEEKRREGDCSVVIAKADKIRKMLGWEPKYNDLELIIKHSLDWEKKILNN